MDLRFSAGEQRWMLCGIAGRAALVALSIVPFCVTLAKTVRYGLRFPYWDEWRLAPLLDKSYQGGLAFLDFWGQHNEHRPVFPRALMLGLARLTDWDVGYELAANFVLAGGILAALVFLAWRDAAGRAGKPLLRTGRWGAFPWVLLPFFSFLVFSWAQMENWVWGWQFQIFLSTLAVVWGVVMLSGRRPSWVRFGAAAVFGIVASYSFANGLLYWIAALPAVAGCANASRQTRAVRTLIWLTGALLVFESYLSFYFTPGESSPSPWAALDHPLAFGGYAVLYLGGPMTGLIAPPAWHGTDWPVTWVQFVPGALGLAGFALLLGLLIVKHRVSFASLAPWLALAGYAACGAIVTGAGRVGFGLGHALTSRYMAISMLFWCALAGLAALWRGQIPDPKPPTPNVRRFAAFAALAAFILAGQGLFIRNNRHWEDICRWKQMGWEAVRAGYPARLFRQDLCYDPALFRDCYLPILEAHGLCGFETYPRKNPARAGVFVTEARRFIREKKWGPARTYLETALVLDPAHAEANRLLRQVIETIHALQMQEMRENSNK